MMRMRCVRSFGFLKVQRASETIFFDESLGFLARVREDLANELVEEHLADMPSPWEICPGEWVVRRRAGLGDVLCLSATVRELRRHGGSVRIATHPNYAPLFPEPEPADPAARVRSVMMDGWLERHPGRMTRPAAQCMGDYWNLDVKDCRPELVLTEAEREYGQLLARDYRHGDAPLVAIFERAGWDTRTWRGFRQVAHQLAGQGCAILGYGDEILPCCKRPPKQSVRDLAALLAACDLVISGDSGPMHLAAAVDTPAIAVFCASSAAGSVGPGYDTDVFEPDGMTCWPCWSASCVLGEVDIPGSCVNAVSATRVIERALTRLAARSATD